MSKPKVLVVDDEPDVLGLVAAALSLRGFEVHTASSPKLALELVNTMPCFDLLMSDVIMPEMCGPELVRKIVEISPTTAVVMMSAYIDIAELPPSVGFISKPFLLSDLYSVVHRALGLGSDPTGD